MDTKTGGLLLKRYTSIFYKACIPLPYSKSDKQALRKLVRLLLVMPATNAVSERSASALRRVKTYLRTTMCDARLNNLVLHVHKDRCDSLVLATVAR